MDATWANSAAKLGTRVVLPDQFEVLLDHCRRPTRGHPASLQGQLQDGATTAQSHYRHLHEAPDLLGVGGSPSPRKVFGRFIRICAGQMPYANHCQRLSGTQDTFSHNLPPQRLTAYLGGASPVLHLRDSRLWWGVGTERGWVTVGGGGYVQRVLAGCRYRARPVRTIRRKSSGKPVSRAESGQARCIGASARAQRGAQVLVDGLAADAELTSQC